MHPLTCAISDRRRCATPCVPASGPYDTHTSSPAATGRVVTTATRTRRRSAAPAPSGARGYSNCTVRQMVVWGRHGMVWYVVYSMCGEGVSNQRADDAPYLAPI